jgi:hypothetical protein
MTMTRQFVVNGIMIATMMLSSATASALTTINSATDGTLITSNADKLVVGIDTSSATDDIIICRVQTGADYRYELVTDSTTLPDDISIEVGGGNDEVYVMKSGESRSDLCSVTMQGGITSGGFFLRLRGGAGADKLAGPDFAGDVEGEADADRVTVRAASTAHGGAADDTVCSDLSSGNESLTGDTGVDCLRQEQSHNSTGTLRCGDSGGGAGDGAADLYDNNSFTSVLECVVDGDETDVGSSAPTCTPGCYVATTF